jgi:hypothetical protein
VVVLSIANVAVCLLWKRKADKNSTGMMANQENNGNGNVSSETNELEQILNSESEYEEPSAYAQLDIFRRVPMDGNYQSLIAANRVELENNF